MDKIKCFVQTVVVPRYWEAAKGRGVRHLEDVLYAARRLVARELDDREYLTVALHDIGVGRTGFTRDEHPRAALVAIAEDEALEPIRGMVDEEMKQAIACHMSDEYKVCGILGPLHQLLVEADEGAPVWGEVRIRKPVKYWLDGRNAAMPPDSPLGVVIPHVLKVLRKKASAFFSGEAPFTGRYQEVFAEEISKACAWINGVGEDDVVSVIESMKSGR
jgi:hypothetical protein